MDYSTSDFRKGLRIELDGDPYLVTESEFMKPGKGSAVYRIKCKNLLHGNVVDKTYRSGDKVKAADVVERPLQYMYNDSTNWFFINLPESEWCL
ncbi:MAG: hypothetical protein AAF517_07595 [Planctomycetota bacterium]